MPSKVQSEAGHWGGRCREAAIELSKLGHLKPCDHDDGDGHTCARKRRYLVHQKYPSFGAEADYEVVKVARLLDDEQAEGQRYDPMLFLLREESTCGEAIWPFYWGKDRRGSWRVGQFPPLFERGHLDSLLEKLGRD